MNGVLQKVTRALGGYAGKRVAVGVSGGRDSVCLLHAVLFCEIFPKENITAVHVNHGLRAEADADENFVRALCDKLGVEFRSFDIDVKKASAESSFTVEQAARELRYRVFNGVIERGEADIVLTAHHALDNAESVLMHLFRGAGLDGLCGIKRSTEFTVRPLLDAYPDEIEQYVNENGLEFVVDKTNFEDDADRNFIRLNVLPLVQKRYGGTVRAINAFAHDCETACGVLDGMLDEGLIGYSYGAVTVCDEALQSTLAARYLRKAAAYFSLTDLTRDMTERAVALKDMRTGATVDMNNGVKAVREYGCVALYVPRAEFVGEYPIHAGANFIDGLAVDITPSAEDARKARGCAVDLEKLSGAVLRFRRDGDYFTPFGGGRKKLKQYFTDKKIPKRIRDRTPVIARGNEVLVIVGVEISELVKQTNATNAKALVTRRW